MNLLDKLTFNIACSIVKHKEGELDDEHLLACGSSSTGTIIS
jgi:hypothetical protein